MPKPTRVGTAFKNMMSTCPGEVSFEGVTDRTLHQNITLIFMATIISSRWQHMGNVLF